MSLCIDPNIFVAALRGRAPFVQERLMGYRPSEVFVPYQVVAELRLGASKSRRPEHHHEKVSRMISPFAIMWPNESSLAHYVDIRCQLERRGESISDADLWIGAIARSLNCTLVTHNLNEFNRISGLKLENWID